MACLREDNRFHHALQSPLHPSKRNRDTLRRLQLRKHNKPQFCSLSIRPAPLSVSRQRRVFHHPLSLPKCPESRTCCRYSTIPNLKSRRERRLLSKDLHRIARPLHNRHLLRLRLLLYRRLHRDATFTEMLRPHKPRMADLLTQLRTRYLLLRAIGLST